MPDKANRVNPHDKHNMDINNDGKITEEEVRRYSASILWCKVATNQ